MKNNLDVITLGEMLIDFIPMEKGVSLKENRGFFREPGGAPANVAVGVARFGGRTAFLGKVGADPFGRFLIDVLNENGVETTYVIQSQEAKTALAFVVLDESGDRDFMFYRDPSADMLYRPDELPSEVFRQSNIFHFGSISLINNPLRETTLRAVEYARDNNMIISYDPNLRPPLWPDLETARRWIIEGLKSADLVKISDDELSFITGESDLENGVDKLMEYNLGTVLVTLGAGGCFVYHNGDTKLVPGYSVEVADTTGAGDAFTAAFLFQLARQNNNKIAVQKMDEIIKMVRLSNGAGALTTTRKGAINSLPDLEILNSFMKERV